MTPTIPNDHELMKFLIERTKDATSPLSIKALAKEFKETIGSSQSVDSFRFRINRIRSNIQQTDSIDTETKVKMMFGLGVPIDMDFLNELPKDADVEVDKNNRITNYKANNGSLELTGDHTQSAKAIEKWQQRKMKSEKSPEDFDDGSRAPRLKTSGSVKRAAAEVSNFTEVPRDSSLERYVKRENYMDDDIEDSQSSTAPHSGAQQLMQPKQKEAPGAPVKPKSETNNAHNAPGATTTPKSEANDAFTSQIKFLEAIQFIVLNLDMPSLYPLQKKIDKMLQESSNERIPNNEMVLAMEMLITKITNNSLAILPESGETVSLKVFLCYLKAAIFNSKLEGLETLMEKIKERINEPASKDKNIPLDKVVSVLQYTLDGI